MQARLVIGFKCDEFNTFDGGYYQIRQSHAHAWVEVLCADGLWKTFDPTSGRDSPGRVASAWMQTKHFFDYLEYKWANSVVAYDGEFSENLVNRADNKLVNVGVQSRENMKNLQKWFSGDTFMTFSSRAITSLIIFMVAAIVGTILYFLYDRWRMHRRAQRIGLDSLPPADQLRLARQLGFYAELMLLLERRQITRPRHLTPLEFSQSLTYLPNEAYSAVRRLTRIF